MIIQLFSNLIATAVVLPFFVLLCVYLTLRLFKPNQIALRTAFDYSTPFFILALFIYAHYVFPTYGLFLMGLGMFVWAVLLAFFIQWISPTAAANQKGKMFWRLCFLSATTVYSLFLVSIVVSYLFH